MTTATPSLVLGPLLRYADGDRASIWVETDRPCEVRVLDRCARTWTVHGHHFALVVVDGLEPGPGIPYHVHLDDTLVWPEPDSRFPPSLLRRVDTDGLLRFSFGSCRRAERFDPARLKQFGADALVALAERMRTGDPDSWPDVLFLAGDQVYADKPDDGEYDGAEHQPDVADFERYCRLYAESWRPEPVRWLLSTVPSCMLLDDHDLRDDWNTSQFWRDTMTAKPWWAEAVTAAFASYWIYQHLGNLSPEQLDRDTTYAMVRNETDDERRGTLLDEFAFRSDAEPESARWSYFRDFDGRVRVRFIAIDSRCGRVLDPDDRHIVDPVESVWLEQLSADPGNRAIDHYLVGSPLPLLLSHGIHDLEGWNEAVAGGAWGARWQEWGEKIRQAADLEHWAAFRKSFTLMTAVLRRLAERADPPASVLFLSGDVHCSYTARAKNYAPQPDSTAVHQLTMSPFRNPLDLPVRFANLFADTRPVAGFGRWLARRAGVADPAVEWDVESGPWFDNGVMTVVIDGRSVAVHVEHAFVADGDQVLRRTATVDLTGPPTGKRTRRARRQRRRNRQLARGRT